jgi:uncharacterized membrane protein YfcA
VDLDLSNAWLVIAVITSISLGALFKGITGAGLPLLAVPMLASITQVEDAVVLMTLPGIAANALLVINHRRCWRVLLEHKAFLVAGFIGGFIGTWLLAALDDRWLKLLLIAWLGLYLYQYFFHRQAGERLAAKRQVSIPMGLAAGTIQGASGISAHVVAPYYHAYGLRLKNYAFALGFSFLLFMVAQLTAISHGGPIDSNIGNEPAHQRASSGQFAGAGAHGIIYPAWHSPCWQSQRSGLQPDCPGAVFRHGNQIDYRCSVSHPGVQLDPFPGDHGELFVTTLIT